MEGLYQWPPILTHLTDFSRLLARHASRGGLVDHKGSITTSSEREKPVFGGPNPSIWCVAALARCTASRYAPRPARVNGFDAIKWVNIGGPLVLGNTATAGPGASIAHEVVVSTVRSTDCNVHNLDPSRVPSSMARWASSSPAKLAPPMTCTGRPSAFRSSASALTDN